MRRIVFVLLLLLLILIPFFLWETEIEDWANRRLAAPHHPEAVAVIVIGLLAADVILPIPSSLVSAAAGALLGFAGGLWTIWTGMTLGSLLGYLLGAVARPLVERRILNEDDLAWLTKAFVDSGGWIVVTTRPLPVLAEGVSLTAGVLRTPFLRFLTMSALANLGVAAAYAAAGKLAYKTESLGVAVALILAVPWLISRLYRRMR